MDQSKKTMQISLEQALHANEQRYQAKQEKRMKEIKQCLEPVRELITEQLGDNPSFRQVEGLQVIDKDEQQRMKKLAVIGSACDMPDYELLDELRRNESKQSLETIKTIGTKGGMYKHLSQERLVRAYKSLEISSDSSINVEKMMARDASLDSLGDRYKRRLNIDQKTLTRDQSIDQIRTKCDQADLVRRLNKMINLEN
jgi:hypothetical protein